MNFPLRPASISARLVSIVAAVVMLLGLAATPSDAASPSTCNWDVCEQITHSGGSMSSWRATVYPGSGFHCRTARFYINGGLYNSKSSCGYGSLTAYASMPVAAIPGNTYCAAWVSETGYACITL